MSKNRNQPTPATPDSASRSSLGGRPRRKPIPPHGFRHSALAPTRWLTAAEVTRLIDHFGTERLESFLRPNKGGPQ